MSGEKLFKDRSGERFGSLVVLRRDHQSYDDGVTRFVCLCDCGRETTVRRTHLISGSTKSCGCRRGERMSALNTARALPTGQTGFNATFARYIEQAQERGYTFSLTEEQAADLMLRACFYCNQPPNNVEKEFVYSGIDRVDNTKGYSSDNCVSCCFTCNKMKGTLSADEFLEHIDRVHSYR